MKTKNIIYPFLALMTIGSVCGAESSVLINHSININESEEEWVLVKEEKGIKVYFTIYEAIDGTSSIKIKFENVEGVEKSFHWGIINRNTNKVIYHSDMLFLIKPNSELIYFEDKTPFSIEIERTLSDYSIIIK